MPKYKHGQRSLEEDEYTRQMYGERYYDNPGYYHTVPGLGLRYPAMGRRNDDYSSSDIDSANYKRRASTNKSRIAIVVAIVLLACALIAGIVVAVYFTSIPAPQQKLEVISEIEVSKIKAYQGEVSLAKDWDVGLSNSNSSAYKKEESNFISAMDAIYTNTSQYNRTVVDGFRNGSIVVEYQIFFLVKVIQKVNTSANSDNGKQGQGVSEIETNPVNTTMVMKVLKDNLPKQIGVNVTSSSQLEEVTTTTAEPTAKPASTGKLDTTTITVSTTPLPETSTVLKPESTTITATKESTISPVIPTLPEPTTTPATTKETTSTTKTVPSTLPTIITTSATTNTPQMNSTTTMSTTSESTLTTRSYSTTAQGTTTAAKEASTNATTIASALPSTIASTATTPTPSTTSVVSSTRSTSTTPEQTSTTTSTTTKPSTTDTTLASTLPSTIATSKATSTPSTTTASSSTPKPTSTTSSTSTTPEHTSTTTSTTTKPSTTVTTLASTLPSTTATSKTTSTPSTTTASSSTPKPTYTMSSTSTLSEHTSTTISTTTKTCTIVTTLASTLPSTIATSKTTSTPSTTTVSSSTPKPTSTTKSTSTTPEHTSTTTSTTTKPSTTVITSASTLPSTIATSTKTTTPRSSNATTPVPMTTPNPCQVSETRELSVSLAFKGLVWHDQLKNSSSQIFQNYSLMVKEAINVVVSQIDERGEICDIQVLMMMNGSTKIIGKVAVLANSFISAATVQEFLRNVNSEQLAGMQLDAANVNVEDIPQGCDVVQQTECFAMGFTYSQTSFVSQFTRNLTDALASYLTDSCTQEMITFALCDSYYPKCGMLGNSSLIPICRRNCLEIQKLCPTLFQIVRANPCSEGSEECVHMYPAYSVECDFNEDMCGYQNKKESNVKWRRQAAPFYMGGYLLFDRGPLYDTYGPASQTPMQMSQTMSSERTGTQAAWTPWRNLTNGLNTMGPTTSKSNVSATYGPATQNPLQMSQTMSSERTWTQTTDIPWRYSTGGLNTMGPTTSAMSNGYILLLTVPLTQEGAYLYSPNFTTAGYNCYLHFSSALAIGYNASLHTDLYLYDSYGYRRTLISQSFTGNLWTGWLDQAYIIPPGDFYLVSFFYGSNFQAALDNIYLSGCNGDSSTPYPFPVTSPGLEIRLSNQTYNYGRVEIRRRNSSDEWGTICDDMWDELDAKVVCHDLGYSEDIEAYSYRGSFFGQGYGPIWMNRVDCNGNELSLSDCISQRWGNIHCTHVQDAGVSCGHYIPTAQRPSTPYYSTVTTPRPSGGMTVRLVDGPNCLVGRVEILYQGQWGTICDDSWSDADAQVICRMLGYSTFGATGYGSAIYGQGTGPILLDDVMCSGYESSIADCSHRPWGMHNCGHYEDAAVSCGGTQDQCFAQDMVNCDFDISNCGYTTAAVSGTSSWTIGYVQGILLLPSTFNTSSSFTEAGNRVAYYINKHGAETDEAVLKSPFFTMNTSTNILEFYYLMNASTLGALRLEGGRMKLWESPVLRSEEEKKWLYQCVNLDRLQPDIKQSVSFYAKQGPVNFRIIAVDSIHLSEGTCHYGLEDTMCDFERPSIHGYKINCTYCKTVVPKFRWYWNNGITPSLETGPDMDHTYGNKIGHYMYAEASYGEEGDATALTFPIVSTKMTFKALQFYYNMYGSDTGSLRVLLEYSGIKNVVWEKNGDDGNVWRKACTMLPENSNVIISFVAVRGPGPFGDIAVDDIQLLMENCPHPITCMEDFQECNYTRSSESDEYVWDWNGDIHGDSLGCNFETDDCRYQSSSWLHMESSNISQLGYIILDPVYGEKGHYVYTGSAYGYFFSYLNSPWFMTDPKSICQLSFMYKCNVIYGGYIYLYVSLYGKLYGWYGTVFYRGHYTSTDWTTTSINIPFMDLAQLTFEASGTNSEIALDEFYFNCGGFGAEGQMTILSSPAFQNKQEPQYLTFYHQIPSTDTIKVMFKSQDDITETELFSSSSKTDSLELVCINLPRVAANSTISFVAIRGDNSIKATNYTAIRRVEVKDGLCPDTLDLNNCTFEDKDALCGRNITSSATPSCSLPVYMWERHSGATWTDGTGPDFDHTFSNQSAYRNLTGTGHYMYADASIGNPGDTTTLTLKDFIIGKFCSLQFFYHMYGNSTSVLRVRETRGGFEKVLSSLNLNTWIPDCLELKTNCTLQESSVRSLSFVAERGNGPWGDIAIDDVTLSIKKCPYATINCTFSDGMCGYLAEYGWELNQTAEGGYLAVKSEESGQLISPSVIGIGCITLYYTGTTEYKYSSYYTKTLTIGNEEYPILMDGQTRMILVPVNTSIAYKLVMKLSGLYFETFYLHNVTFSSECPMLDCQQSDFACKYYCIYEANTCDGYKHCSDGSDEADHLCPPSIECDFNKMYACNYTFTNAFITTTDYYATPDLQDYKVQLYSVLSFMESPAKVFDNMSCLQYNYIQYGEGRHRLVSNLSGFLQNLYIFDGLKAQGIPVTLQANLPRGNYSILFEFQTFNITGSYAQIDNVKILAGSCQNYSISCNLDEEFACHNTMWNGDLLEFCVPNANKCNRRVDCSGGSDEMDCSYSPECDFNEHMCGYQNNLVYNGQWKRMAAPIQIGGYLLVDRGPLPSFNWTTIPTPAQYNVTLPPGGTWTQGSGTQSTSSSTRPGIMNSTTSAGSTGYVLALNASYKYIEVSLYSPNFINTGYNCYLHFSEALSVGYGGWLGIDVSLYNNNNYVSTLSSRYYYETFMTEWVDKTFYISPGDFHLTFRAYGRNFEIALDNIYLTGCNGNSEWTTPIAATMGLDGCYENPVSACVQYGFDRVIMPSITGHTSITEAGNQLMFLFNNIWSLLAYEPSASPCMNPLLTFLCGSFMSDCVTGVPHLLCREPCEAIAERCLNTYMPGIMIASNIKYFCKFLPYQVDDQSCIPINISDVETNVTVPNNDSKPMVTGVRLVNGDSSFSGRLEVLVNGIWGTVCNSIYNFDIATAATFCFELGFRYTGEWVYGSYYGYGPSTLISSIYCPYGARDLDNCTIEFGSYCPYYYYNNMGLVCDPGSATCDFQTSECGYYGDKWYRTFSEDIYLMTSSAKEGEVTELMSPRFTAKSLNSVTFTYKITKWISGKYMLSVDDGKNRTALWHLDGRKLEGVFKDCVEVQGFRNTKIQLVFSVLVGQPQDTTRFTVPGVISVTVKSGSCPGVFPDVPCTFESSTACTFVATCNNKNSYRFEMTSGEIDSSNTQMNLPTLNKTGHYMIADASYGEEGDSADFKISVTVQPNQYFLRYQYYMSGPDVGDLKVHIVDKHGPSSILIHEHDGDQGDSWSQACLTISNTNLTMFYIVFTATRGNGTQGDIAVDDIEFNTKPCPHPVSCDFERPNYCDYNISQTEYHWQVDYLWQQDGTQLASGNIIKAYEYGGSEGDVAEISTPTFKLGADTKCVSFSFIMYGEDVGSLKVYIVYDNVVTHKKLSFSAVGNQGSHWYKANSIIQYANSSYRTATVVFSATKGDGTDSFIGLDNVIISSEECIYGIQTKVCDFNDPYLCGFQSNCSSGSQYQWQVYNGSSMTNGTGAISDANEDSEGSYLTVDSSYGDLGDVSFSWFPPIHTLSTTKLIFDYIMYGVNEDFNNLTVLFGTQSRLIILDQLCCNRGSSWNFKCLPLPINTQGTVYFKATRQNGVFGDISVDNVGLIEGNCPMQSVACEFEDNFKCGYRGWERALEDNNYFMNLDNPNGTSFIVSPFSGYDGPSCIGFEYKVLLDDFSWSGSGLSLIVKFEMTSGEHSETMFAVTEDTGDDWVSGQVQIPYLNNAIGFRIIFAANGTGEFAVDKIILGHGDCLLPTCAPDEFACIEKCIPIAQECDKIKDCANGRDERVSCTPSIACDFETAYHCGYQNTSYTSRNTGWEWVNNQTSRTWNATRNISAEVNEKGSFLVARPLSYYDIVSVQSPTEKLEEQMCLRFSYFGNGVLNVYINDITLSAWSDVVSEQFYWQTGQVQLPVGDVSIRFSASMNISSRVDSIIGINNIELINGSCGSHDISCSEFDVRCLDNSMCVGLQQLCNRIPDCPDGSDESENNCPVMMTCQFEDGYLCGYRNLQNSAKWNHRSGNFFKLPQYDHTYGNKTGHFLIVYNTSDLWYYYNTLGWFGPGYPSRLEYSNATLISPRVEFMNVSCVYFYYYLNGTAVRPNPLSAQIFVYVNSSSGKRLAWYDHINRTVNGWLKGWVRVNQGPAEVIFVAKTITTTTVWPGVVALDDVYVTSRPCPANPDCGRDTFRCTTSRICIPVYMQCDGGNDCLDGSDEENCLSKPNYLLDLINGDGSYGSITIFYQGLWRPVCMSKYSLTTGSDKIVQLACRKVGYTGRYQGAFVNSWQQPVQRAMQVTCNYYDEDISRCAMNLTSPSTSSCYYYQAALCSNDECFSGERLCPPDHTNSSLASSKCISHRYFCDGIPDCPGATDELNCANCSTTEFECSNHQCIPASQKCDGTPQCGDNSDEYGCVVVANNMSQIYHSYLSAYLPVCYKSMTGSLADMLCSLNGQGSSSHYQQYTYVLNGTLLTPQENATVPSLVPGYTLSVEPCYSVLIQCRSIKCGTTIFDDRRLPKILFGRDAVLGQLPWQIALYYDGQFICGGSIIHPNWILTAAHCTSRLGTYSVVVGAVEVGESRSGTYQGRSYYTSRTYNNPLYNSDVDNDNNLLANDNSLLYFNQPITLDNNVRPICIASRKTVDEMLQAGYSTECYISGWGNVHGFVNGDTWEGSLQVVRVYLYSKEECNQIYYNLYNSYPQNTTVCVDNQNFGSPACFGDSGGPLICRNKYGRFELLGTTSWGYQSCFKDGYPDVYQLAYPHASWLERTTGLRLSDLTMDID